MCILHFFHNEYTMEIAYAIDIAKLGAHKLLVWLHIASLYFQREVIFTTRIIALGDFFYILYLLLVDYQYYTL